MMHIDKNICDNVLSLLRKITRSIDQRSRNLIKQYGFTVPQLLILKEICQNNDEILNSTQIAKKINLAPATITPIIDKLVQRGFVERKRSSSDKRSVELFATKKGFEVYQNAPTLMHEKFVDAFCNLEKWEQSMILSALERIASMIDVKADDVASLLTAEPIL